MSDQPLSSRNPGDEAALARAFDEAAVRIFDAVDKGGRPADDDLEAVLSGLRSIVVRTGLTQHDAEDIAQEITVQALALGELARTINNPAAYLTRLARNRAVDEYRRKRRGDVEIPAEFADRHNDAVIAALLDSSPSVAAVRVATRAAMAAEDHLVVRVISTWLDMAQECGGAPSARQVAKRAGVSHTSVNTALKSFRAYLPSELSK